MFYETANSLHARKVRHMDYRREHKKYGFYIKREYLQLCA
jgi:hypothetical protein